VLAVTGDEQRTAIAGAVAAGAAAVALRRASEATRETP
jgi:hypothetical protein